MFCSENRSNLKSESVTIVTNSDSSHPAKHSYMVSFVDS